MAIDAHVEGGDTTAKSAIMRKQGVENKEKEGGERRRGEKEWGRGGDGQVGHCYW